ncbi:trypsin-like peptidase domain-containing protein [Mycoplasmatota bacterium WC30]
MKKLYIFLGILLTVVLGLSLNKVIGNSLANETTILVEELTDGYTHTVIFDYGLEDEQYYVYTGYQDLIDQIRADIFDDVYDQIYAEVIDQLGQEFYDEVYDLVEAELVNLLSEDEFELYVKNFQNQLYDVVEIAEKSVFGVTNYSAEDVVHIGSGVIYKYDETENLYYIVTNQHVINNSETIEIQFSDESTVPATLIGYDTEVDIAVLTFEAGDNTDIVVSDLGDSNDVGVSDFLLAVGNPLGYNFFNTVTMGIVSGVERKVDSNLYIDYVQHDASINTGNSGGPIYNLEGEVIGINVRKVSTTEIEGMGFAIPINLVKEVIGRIEAGNMVADTIMPRIGCTYTVVEENTDGTDVFLDRVTINGTVEINRLVALPTGVDDGLVIRSLTEGGGTLDGYLKSGDLIVAIDEYQITDETGFLDNLYANYYAGDLITIYYYEFDGDNLNYNPELMSVTVTLI